jgi:hypothetical protein
MLRDCRHCGKSFDANTCGKLCADCRRPRCVVCGKSYDQIGVRRRGEMCSRACNEARLLQAKVQAAGTAEAPIGSRCIPLTRGLWAIVDESDYEWLSKYSWQAVHTRRGLMYARRRMNGKRVSMHRLLVDAEEVDHINGNTLDNRRCNLRPATHAQNIRNSARKGNSGYRFKGVYLSGKRWHIRITVDGRQVSHGPYQSEEDAARAYDAAARTHYGEFARLNFPGAA